MSFKSSQFGDERLFYIPSFLGQNLVPQSWVLPSSLFSRNISPILAFIAASCFPLCLLCSAGNIPCQNLCTDLALMNSYWVEVRTSRSTPQSAICLHFLEIFTRAYSLGTCISFCYAYQCSFTRFFHLASISLVHALGTQDKGSWYFSRFLPFLIIDWLIAFQHFSILKNTAA